MSTDATTTGEPTGIHPGAEATTGANFPPGSRGEGPRGARRAGGRRRHAEPDFRSY